MEFRVQSEASLANTATLSRGNYLVFFQFVEDPNFGTSNLKFLSFEETALARDAVSQRPLDYRNAEDDRRVGLDGQFL